MMASVIRNSFSAVGTLPTSASMPRAKAISVAVGIAQPCIATSVIRIQQEIDHCREYDAAKSGHTGRMI